ncbi:MAG: hypothetical protein ACOX5A_06085 [Aminivibrio sp.]|nr:flagellar hook-length control protein FliK [Synergistaceae bacterium]
MTARGIGGIQGPSVRPGLPEGQPRVDESLRQPGTRLPGFADGTVVNGRVLEAREEGTYLVRVAGQNLLARANMILIPGQHFRAVWDSSGNIPVLRLSDAETALLGKLAPGDRELASALISRGLPMNDQALASLRTAWTAMGGLPEQLGPMAELWARGLPLTSGNVQILAWYLNLGDGEVSAIWKKIREDVRRRAGRGENPASVLKELMDGGDDKAAFLKGHGLLSKPSRDGVDPSLLAPALLPAGDGDGALMARITTGAWKRQGKSFWSVSFEVEGDRLGPMSGDVETDGRNLGVVLKAEREDAFEILNSRRRALRRELGDLAAALQGLVIVRGRRVPRIPGRGIDITV